MSSKFIIFYVIILSTLLLVFNNLKAEFEKPYSSELIGTNLRIDRNDWNTQNNKGNWELQNLRFDEDGCFDWANWECTGVGTECRVGDWATRWSFVRSTSPGDGWIQNQNGEWEPPLPNEPGLWQSLYPLYFPLSYDPINNFYY